MEKYKRITINHFRGISHLEISDLAGINIFLGGNNSGKSSVLEAVFLITGMSNPRLPLSINTIRRRGESLDMKDIVYLFHNLNINESPTIEASTSEGNTRDMALIAQYEDESQKSALSASLSSEPYRSLDKLHIKFRFNDEHYDTELFRRGDGKLVWAPDQNYKESLIATLLPANLIDVNLRNDISEIIRQKRKDKLLTQLANFDSRIKSIDVLDDDIYLGMEEMTELLPLTMAGDGLRRYLSILSAAGNAAKQIILIDELDNGLHYSAYPKLWKGIIQQTMESWKQLFITTHSKEILSSLVSVLQDATPAVKDEIRLYTLENTRLKGQQAYCAGYEGLVQACQNDIEMRGMVYEK